MNTQLKSHQLRQQQTRHRGMLLLLYVGASVLFSMLFIRLGHIQLVSGSTFLKHADENRFFSVAVPGPRGLLLDRYGQPLVWNIQHYQELADPTSLFSTVRRVSRTEGLQLIATQGAQSVSTKLQRLYRYPNSLAHVVGYVGEVTAEDLQNNSALRPGMTVGKAGLELMFEEKLHGRDGSNTYEVNALGKKQRLVKEQAPHAGETLRTSLDPFLSEIASRKLGDVRGVVVITDTDTGKVLAMTSKPTFDPNIFSQMEDDPQKEQQRKDAIKGFFTDPRNLFFNRAISGAYPPGSVFKLVTAAAGLELGKFTESTEVVDNGVLEVNGFTFGNWYFRQYGRTEGAIQLQRAIARSNDIYFYKAAEWIGPTSLAEYSRLFGYGSKIGIELPAEVRGLVPDPQWKEKQRGEAWYLGNTYHFGIGQGDMLTTPLQVAQMTQVIARHGEYCQLSVLDENPTGCKQLGLKAEHLRPVIAGMIDACSAGGTAYPFFPFNTQRRLASPEAGSAGASVDQLREQGVIACKTGTAEFGGADAQGHRRTHAWFTSFLRTPASATQSATVASPLPSPAIIASASASVSADASSSAALSAAGHISDDDLHRLWLEQKNVRGFPRNIGLTVLVESDDTVPYREGSKDGAPVAKQIIDWMMK